MIYCLFLISGFAGLALEVVWLRQLGWIYGVTAPAVAVVLAAFLGGLGLGSAVLGRAADRARDALRAYGWLEIGIAVTAAATTLALDALAQPGAPASLAGGGSRSPAIALLPPGIILLVPTVLMGATLPLMSRVVVRGLDEAGARVGILYALNTLGAAAGGLATGFVLIPKLGVIETALAAAALDATVGLLALLLSVTRRSLAVAGGGTGPRAPRQDSGGLRRTSAPAPARPGPLSVRTIIVLAAMTGFTALGYEVVWTRLLVYSIANTVYSFAAMLSTFLVGLVAGSAIAYVRLRQGCNPVRDLAWTQIGAGAAVLLGLLFLPHLLPENSARSALSTWPELLGATLGPAIRLVLLPTLLVGQAFPLLNALRIREVAHLGRQVGGVYAANTLGSIAGALGVGLALLPALGAARTTALLAATNLALGGALLTLRTDGFWNRRVVLISTLVAAALIAVIAPGRNQVRELLLRDSTGRRDPSAVLAFEEGATTTVAIVDDRAGYRDPGAKRLITDGVNMSGTNWNAKRYMKFLVHLPLLLHPNPQSVLVIGFGTGMTAGAAALHPGVAEVVSVELAPEVVRGGRLFAEENHHVLDQKKHRLIVADGRQFLRRPPACFDVILAEPPPPRASGTVHLYSREYYEACKDALNPGGLVLQWMPLHSQGDSELRAKLHTFLEVFPEASLWLPMGEEAIILATTGPNPLTILGDRTQLSRRMSDPELAPALAEVGLAAPEDLLACFWMGPAALERYTRDLPVITDRQPYTQHYIDHPRLLDPFDLLRLVSLREPLPPALAGAATRLDLQAAASEAHGELVRGQVLDHPAQVLEALRIAPANRYYQQMSLAAPDQEAALLGELERRPEPRLRLARAQLRAARGDYEESLTELGRIIHSAPGWPQPRIMGARTCLRAGDPGRGLQLLVQGLSSPAAVAADPALAAVETLLQVAATTLARPADIDAGLDLVDLALAAGELGVARREAARLLALAPGDPNVLAALARALDVSGYPERAMPLYEQLMGDAPADPAITRALARSLFYAGRAASAEPLLAKVVDGNPRDWEAHRLRAEVLRELGRYRDAASAIAPLRASPDRADRLLAQERIRAYRGMAGRAGSRS